MSRKTISIGDMDDYRYQATHEPLPDYSGPRGSDYVSFEVDGTPFEGLLWREIRQIERNAHMTVLQAQTWEWSLRGLKPGEIASAMQRDESTIRQHIENAERKASKVKHRGLLTVMIETVGIEMVKEALSDGIERNTPPHKNARLSKEIAYELGLIDRIKE